MNELGVRAPVRVIDAHGGKKTRAEPVALLFETGRAHMVGVHEVLEERFVQFTGQGGKSLDRLDAACHAIRELISYRTTTAAGGGVARYADATGAGVYRRR